MFCQVIYPGSRVQVNCTFPGSPVPYILPGGPFGVHSGGLSPGLASVPFAGVGHWALLLEYQGIDCLGLLKISLWCLAVKSVRSSRMCVFNLSEANGQS